MEPELAAALLGLGSAISWGGGDFCGGLASRRAPLRSVLTVGAASGLLLLLVLAFATRDPIPPLADLAWALGAGLFGTAGLALLYRGLSVGRAAVVAPTSAVLSAALPVVVGAVWEGLPTPVRLLGFTLALVGIWLVARTGDRSGAASGVGLATLAGVSFGAFFILIDRASAASSFWPLVMARATTLALTGAAMLLAREHGGLGAGSLQLALLTGVLDVGGNILFVLATQVGRLDVAAVLASLYPASTVVLAGTMLGERIHRSQMLGLLVTLLAIVLIVL